VTGKPVIRRERARRDLEEAADYHFAEGGPRVTGKPVIRRERARRDLEEAADYHFAEGGEAFE